MESLPADVLVLCLAAGASALPFPALSGRDVVSVACTCRALGGARPAALLGLTVAEAAAREAVTRLLAPAAPPARGDGEAWTLLLHWAQRVTRGAAGAGGALLPLPLVAVGTFHSLLVDASGRLLRCGAFNEHHIASVSGGGGASGGADDAAALAPQPVAGAPRVRFVAVAAASHHNLALDARGGVYAFGRPHGCLCAGVAQAFLPAPADGAAADGRVPRLLRGALCGVRVVALACGDHHSACVSDGGVAFTWGRGEWGRLGHGDEADVPAPRALRLEEAVVAVAAANGAAIASSAKQPASPSASQVASQSLAMPLTHAHLSLSPRAAHTALITRSGALLTCGYGRFGRLGQGDETTRVAPTRVAALAHARVVAVAVADDHTAAVTDSGALYTFGYGGFGQLCAGRGGGGGGGGGGADDNDDNDDDDDDADGSSYGRPAAPGALVCRLLPVRVRGALGAARVVGIAAGGYHTVALDATGAVWSAGWAAYGNLGRGLPLQPPAPFFHAHGGAAAIQPRAARVDGGALSLDGGGGGTRAVRSVTAGCHHTLCVTDDGRLVGFGRGAGGRLGNGAQEDAPLPVEASTVRLPRQLAPPHVVLPPPDAAMGVPTPLRGVEAATRRSAAEASGVSLQQLQQMCAQEATPAT
jgi:alpha-tubulin suppressor-like RCC1 family protein